MLTRPYEEELAARRGRARRRGWTTCGRTACCPRAPTCEETVEALHRYLTLTPARLLNVALTDAVGDRRAQNQPGTTNEYPNWRVPLTDPDGEPVLLEDVFASDRARSIFAVLED